MISKRCVPVASTPENKTHRERLLLEVTRLPGLTSEAYASLCGIARRASARRLPELREAGLVHSTRAPHDELRWYPTKPHPLRREGGATREKTQERAPDEG